jgi:hypothetical protein
MHLQARNLLNGFPSNLLDLLFGFSWVIARSHQMDALQALPKATTLGLRLLTLYQLPTDFLIALSKVKNSIVGVIILSIADRDP